MNNYIIKRVKGFTDTQFYKAMKTWFKIPSVFVRENTGKMSKELIDNILSLWDSIEELTIAECFAEQNTEKRRVLFSIYGPENIFKSVKTELVDTQTLTKNNIRIVNGKEEEYTFQDTYSLYKITDPKFKKALFEESRSMRFGRDTDLFIVHCKCTTTGRDYYLWTEANSDAISAIASTFRLNCQIKDVEQIYRQGDVLLCKLKDGVSYNTLNGWFVRDSLSKQQYINLLKIES